jgi:hypothetical protein
VKKDVQNGLTGKSSMPQKRAPPKNVFVSRAELPSRMKTTYESVTSSVIHASVQQVASMRTARNEVNTSYAWTHTHKPQIVSSANTARLTIQKLKTANIGKRSIAE